MLLSVAILLSYECKYFIPQKLSTCFLNAILIKRYFLPSELFKL